jgi:hypothetical protein
MSRLVSATAVGMCLLVTGAMGASLRAAAGPAEAADNHNFHMALNPATQGLVDSIRTRVENELDKEIAARADSAGELDQRLAQLERKEKDESFAYETAMTGNDEIDAAYENTVQGARHLAQEQLAPFAAATERSLADLKAAESEKEMLAASLKEARARADEARASRDEVMARAHAEFNKVHEMAESTYKSVGDRVEDAWVHFQKTSKDGYDMAAAECERIFASREVAFEKDEALVESLKPDLQRLSKLCAAEPVRFVETGESSGASQRAARGQAVLPAEAECAAARKKMVSATGALMFLQLPSDTPTNVDNNDPSLAGRLANWEHAVAHERADATAAKKRCIAGALELQSAALQHVLKHKNEEMVQAKKNLKAEFESAKAHLDETKKEAHDEVKDASEPLPDLSDKAQSSSAEWSKAKAQHDEDEERQTVQKVQSEAAVREAKRKAKDARDEAFEFQKSISEMMHENVEEDLTAKRKEIKEERNDVAAEMSESLHEQKALLAALGDEVELPDMTGPALGGEEDDLDMGATASAAVFGAVSTAFEGATAGEFGETNGEGKQ